MREFHKIMFEHEARLKYTDSGIEVFLDNSCSLKAVKDIAEAFYIEFGTSSDRIKLESAANNYICLVVPVLDGRTEDDGNKIEAEDEENNPEYTEKILNTSLEALSESKTGFTSAELQQELAKRGIIATSQWIGKLLAESGKALRVGRKWYIKDSAREIINQSSWNGWKPLTDKVGYRIEGDDIVLGFKKPDDKIETLKRVPYNLLEDLYKALPDEANSADIVAMATAVGIENVSNLETYFMRILANEFGGEVQRIGRSLILVKGGLNEGSPD
jgi:hypothetical protein